MVSRRVTVAKRREIYKSPTGNVDLDRITGADGLKAAPRLCVIASDAARRTFARSDCSRSTDFVDGKSIQDATRQRE
jgi:hypothetical protein